MLYVVRHGQTDWNLTRKIQGKTDIPLNANGIEQANSTRDFLKNVKFSFAFSSPLKRAKETAEIICNSSTKVTLDGRIEERGMGDYEGKSPETFDIQTAWNYEINSEMGNIEKVKNLYGRVSEFLEEYKDIYQNEDVLLVTHGGVIPAILAYFNGIPEDNNFFRRKSRNCEIIKIDNNGDISYLLDESVIL